MCALKCGTRLKIFFFYLMFTINCHAQLYYPLIVSAWPINGWCRLRVAVWSRCPNTTAEIECFFLPIWCRKKNIIIDRDYPMSAIFHFTKWEKTCCWWWCHRGGWALDDWTWPQEVGQCWGSGLYALLERTSSKWLQPALRLQQEWQWTGQYRTKWSLQNGNPQTDSLPSAENRQFLRFYGLTEVNSLITLCLRSQSPSIRAANTPLQKTWH